MKVPANVPVYLLVAASNDNLPALEGWTPAGTAEYTDRYNSQVAVYKRTFSVPTQLAFPETGWAGTVIAARKLVLVTGDYDVDRQLDGSPTGPAMRAPTSHTSIAGPTAAPPRIDANPMTAAVPSPRVIVDPLDDATYVSRYAEALKQAGPTPTAADAPISGARITHIDRGGPAANAGLHVGDILVAIDGRSTPDRATAQAMHRIASAPQKLEVINNSQQGRRLIKVEPGQLGMDVEDCWLPEGQYIHDLPAGTPPVDEMRVAARCAVSNPTLAESALARARRIGGPATTGPAVNAIAAISLFNDGWYEDALAYATAASPKLPVESQIQLNKIIVDSALATFRYPLALTTVHEDPRYGAGLGSAADDVAAFASVPHDSPEPNPIAASLPFTDQNQNLSNLAPHSNREFEWSAYGIWYARYKETVPFSSPDGTYKLVMCGPEDANIDFSASCHFAVTDNGRSGFTKMVYIGVASHGKMVKLLELYPNGIVDVASTEPNGAPDHAPLNLRRIIADNRTFHLRMTIVGDRCEFVIDGRRIFYGPMPSDLAEADRKLSLHIQTVGLTGEFGEFHWRTAPPRKR